MAVARPARDKYVRRVWTLAHRERISCQDAGSVALVPRVDPVVDRDLNGDGHDNDGDQRQQSGQREPGRTRMLSEVHS